MLLWRLSPSSGCPGDGRGEPTQRAAPWNVGQNVCRGRRRGRRFEVFSGCSSLQGEVAAPCHVRYHGNIFTVTIKLSGCLQSDRLDVFSQDSTINYKKISPETRMLNTVCNFLPNIATSSGVLLKPTLRWASHVCLLWRQKVQRAFDWVIRAACQQNCEYNLKLKDPRSGNILVLWLCLRHCFVQQSHDGWGRNSSKPLFAIKVFSAFFEQLGTQIQPN